MKILVLISTKFTSASNAEGIECWTPKRFKIGSTPQFTCLTCWMNSSLWSIIIFWGGPYKKNILIIALEISDAETSHRGKITTHFVNQSVMMIAYTWLLLLAWKGPARSTVTTLHGLSTLRRCCFDVRITVFFATWQCWQA